MAQITRHFYLYPLLFWADLKMAPSNPHAFPDCVNVIYDLLLTSRKAAKVMRSHFCGQVQDSCFFFMRLLFTIAGFDAVSCYAGRSM